MKDNTVGKIYFILGWLMIAINLLCAFTLDIPLILAAINLIVVAVLLSQHIAYKELNRLYNPKNWFKE